jgi:hypothetical protein
MHGSVLTGHVRLTMTPFHARACGLNLHVGRAAECTVNGLFVYVSKLNLYDACMLAGANLLLPHRSHACVLQVMWRLTMMPLPCPCVWDSTQPRCAAECTVNGFFCVCGVCSIYDAWLLCARRLLHCSHAW